MYFGDDPSSEVIDSYTRVLMGVINLAMAVFPIGTLETNMDFSVRKHLYSLGEDYK